MDIEAPYLEAIQAIAGKTPGEKQKTINIIAREIAQAEKSDGHSNRSSASAVKSQIPDVPEPLKPLVRAEVAKILHQYDGIIDALKNEDITVVSRALQAKWFFDGSDTRFVNGRYFLENVFPEISIYARFKIVKNLGVYLKNTAVAADFFETLTQLYGVSEAIPLLMACDEDFAFKMITENQIVLSIRMVETLFRKYPNLVIKYLMLSKPDDDDVRNLYRINIRDYQDFLPELANKRFEDFMKIYRMHDGLDVKLGKKGASTFIKTQLDSLVEKPDKYLRLVSLKTATQKLSSGDFAKMFRNLFPGEKEGFHYSTLNRYLQYYGPEEKKLPLILNTFREVYGKDLLSCKDLVDSDLIQVLPTDDRVKQARLKLEDDKDWHLYDPEHSWRCYLPTAESIPTITKEIAKSSDAGKRGQLLIQMIYTSKVNEDKDALLEVLNYIYDRHRNDQKYIFYSCLSKICNSFDLTTLNSDHWAILNKYIKFAEIQGDICNQVDKISRLIEGALHYCFLNELTMDEYIRVFVDMEIQIYRSTWNILIKYPDLEKKFLDLFIEVIPKQYPFDNKIWEDNETNIIISLSSSLWDFNKRNKNSNLKPKKLSVKDYPWLFEKIEKYILGETEKNDYSKYGFLELVRENERDLYSVFIRELDDEFWTSYTSIIVDVLKERPERVLDNWKACLETVQSTLNYREQSSTVITKSRWYQQLPIKFFNESLKTYNDPDKCTGSIVTLALLADGETFAKIIEPYIPTDKEIDVDHPDAKNNYSILLAIASNLRKVNPPVSLELIGRFCLGDYLQMAIRSLTSVCSRVPLAKVIQFAKTLTNKPVSVMKHGIRLMYLVAPLEEIYTYLTDLWNSKGHTSIRLVVFNKIYDLFFKERNSRSWRMIRTCLDNLNANDDEALFTSLTDLSKVPNEYLHEYIESVLNAMKSMEKKADDPKMYVDIGCQIIKNIDGSIAQILPGEYCQGLIKEYLFVFDYNSDIFAAGMKLAVDGYLLSSKKYNESRFKFFGDFFRNSVKEHWDKPHPKCFKFYPINFMIHEFFNVVCSATNDKHDVQIFESFLEIFKSALQPHQDALAYLNLVYSIAYHESETSVDFGTRVAKKIPELIEAFSSECVISMSDSLTSFIENRTFSESESSEEKLLALIEVFVNSGAIHCAFFAANMLFDNTSKKLNERHRTVVHALRNYHHPGVSWYLNQRLASFDFRTDNNDE